MIKINKRVRLALRNLILKCGEVSTDKGKLLWDSSEDLKAGDEVFVENEEGEVNPAPDGDYATEDGKTIVVVEGKVSEIKDPEAEVSNEEFKMKAIKMSESYDEKWQKIAAAVIAEGEDAYIGEAGDDYAIKVSWNTETGDYTYTRYAISWDEEGNVIVGDSEEVKPAYVPVNLEMADENEPEADPADDPEGQEDNRSVEDRIASLEGAVAELRDGIEALTNAIAAVADRVAEIEEKIKGLEEPAADPAEEGEETEEKFVSKMSYLNRNKK